MDPAPAPYMIRINGHLGATVLSAFPALAPQHHGAHTVLTGLLDRSALYGVLAEIEALGLDLLEIRKLTPDRTSPKPGDSRSQWRPLPSGASVSLRGGCRSHDQCPRCAICSAAISSRQENAALLGARLLRGSTPVAMRIFRRRNAALGELAHPPVAPYRQGYEDGQQAADPCRGRAQRCRGAIERQRAGGVGGDCDG